MLSMIIQVSQETGYILCEEASRFYGEGTGFLSLKSFFNGQAHYTSEGGHHVAGDSSYLILNHDQAYTIEIASQAPVESFCVFFTPELTEVVYQSLNESFEQALDSPVIRSSRTPLFFDRAYPHDSLLSPA